MHLPRLLHPIVQQQRQHLKQMHLIVQRLHSNSATAAAASETNASTGATAAFNLSDRGGYVRDTNGI